MQGHGFHLWSGKYIPHVTWRGQEKEKNIWWVGEQPLAWNFWGWCRDLRTIKVCAVMWLRDLVAVAVLGWFPTRRCPCTLGASPAGGQCGLARWAPRQDPGAHGAGWQVRLCLRQGRLGLVPGPRDWKGGGEGVIESGWKDILRDFQAALPSPPHPSPLYSHLRIPEAGRAWPYLEMISFHVRSH